MGSDLNRRVRARRILEPRILFDASALSTAVAAAGEPAPDVTATQDASLLDALSTLPPATQSTEIYVVDGSLSDAAALVDSLRNDGKTAVLIDSGADGITQLLDALASYEQVDSLKILAHGRDGMFRLGNTLVDRFTLEMRSSEFAQLGSRLSSDGDLLIYGCNVAKTDAGAGFVRALSSLTGADVGASSDITGASNDWDLEVYTGPVDDDVSGVLAGYMGDLNLDGVFVATETRTLEFGWAMDSDGNIVAAGSNGRGVVTTWIVSGATRTAYDITKPAGWSNEFGRGLAVDGNTLIVADPASDYIAIYQYAPSETPDPVNGPWKLRYTKTTGMAGLGYSTENAGFGEAYYLSIDGRHAVVGLPNEGSGAGAGRVWWFADRSSAGNWSDVADGSFDEPADGQSTDTSGEGSNNSFGASVAVAQDYLVVGNPTMDTNGNNDWSWGNNGQRQGRVFIYSWAAGSDTAPTRYTNGSWSFLSGPNDIDGINGGNGSDDARFGSVVDLDYYNGKYTLGVSAPDVGDAGSVGVVYVYQSTGTDIGTLQTPSRFFNQTDGGDTGDRYGASLRVSEGKILVGAHNEGDAGLRSVFYYEDNDGTWASGFSQDGGITGTSGTLQAGTITYRVFSPSEASIAANSRFGWSLGFTQGNFIAVGSPSHNASNGGVSFFYVRTPVAVDDAFSVSEDAVGDQILDVIKFSSPGGTAGKDIMGTETLASVTGNILSATKTGTGTFTWDNTNDRLLYNVGQSYEYLGFGQTGSATIRYTLKDDGSSFLTQASVVVTINGVNDAPVVSEGIPAINVPKSIDGTASTGSVAITNRAFFDIDNGDSLTYTLVSATSLGVGGVLNGSSYTGVGVGGNGTNGTAAPGGAFTVTGSNINYNLSTVTEYSQYKLVVRATDSQGASVTYDVLFTVGRRDNTPALVGGAINVSTAEDAVYTRNLTTRFSDSDDGAAWEDPFPLDGLDTSEVLTYSLISASGPGPSWLTVSASGTLSGVPTNDNVGVHSIIVRATDIYGQFRNDTITITVTNTNDAPVLTTEIPRQTAVVASPDQAFSFAIADTAPNPDNDFYFADPDNQANVIAAGNAVQDIVYRAYFVDNGIEITTSANASSLGEWLRFNGTTFSGTPSSSGNPLDPLGTILRVRLVASDDPGFGVGRTSSTIFEIGVFPQDGSSAVLDPTRATTAGSRLGTSAAISADGRWAVYGAPGSNSGNGEIRVYENVAGTWTWRNTFTTAAVDARLGTAVDISDVFSTNQYRIVAGAPYETSQAGAVYYYTFNGTSWAANGTAKGTASDAAAGDRFGTSVAINQNGTKVLVGSPMDDDAGTNAGSAYYFDWGVASAPTTVKLLPTTDGSEAGSARAGDLFGSSVAMDQNMLLVGAYRDDHGGYTDAGSVYAYVLNAGLTAVSDSVKLKKTQDIASGDYFGWSVDIDSFGTLDKVIVAVGAYGDDLLDTNAGAVYIYRSDGMIADRDDANAAISTLAQQAVITAYDGDALEGFGLDVAIDVDSDNVSGPIRLAVGSDVNGSNPGSVYAYRYWAAGGSWGGGWIGQRYLANNAGATGVNATTDTANMFGYAVDIAKNLLVAGAPNAERLDTPTRLVAGHIYAVSLATSKIETAPLSGSIVKTVGSEGPVTPTTTNYVAGADASYFGGTLDFDDWLRRYARYEPSGSAVGTEVVPDHAIARDRIVVSGIADPLLYARQLAPSQSPSDAQAAAPAGADAQPACQEEAADCGAPAESGVPVDAPQADASRAFLRLSEQIAVVQGQRSAAASRLVDSLQSLVN